MSLAQLWATFYAARWRILLMVAVATGVAFYLAEGLPKQYTAKARVMLDSGNPDPAQFSELKRLTEGDYIGTQMRLAAGDDVARAVVDKLGWPDNPQVIAAWETATGGVGDAAKWAAGQLKQNIGVQPIEDSSIIEILYTSSSPEAAKAIVGQIRTAFIEQNLKVRADAARRAALWNATEAKAALAELRKAEAARSAFMAENRIELDTAKGGLDYTAQTTAMMNSVGALGAAVAAAPAAEDPAVTRLREQLNTLDAEIAVLRLKGEENPMTVTLIARRDLAAQQLAREVAVTTAGPRASDAQIGAVRQQRDADYLAARLRLIDRAPLYNRLSSLDREVALRTQRYNAIAAHAASFAEIAAAPSGLNVIGDVIASDDPAYPNIPLILAIAAGSSFALASALALVGDLVRRQVRGPEDLLFYADTPVLAVIPRDPPPRGRWRRRLARLIPAVRLPFPRRRRARLARV
jgi:uncharacterized protein involved in exopolysaccharide biosynthesis